MLWPMICLAALVLSGGDPPPDKVKIGSKKPVEGIILRHDSSGLWLAQKSRVRHYPAEDVIWAEGPRVAYAEYVERMRAEMSKAPDADRCVELAQWCEKVGLVDDAPQWYWRALLDDADHEAANQALGHKKSRGRYTIKIKGESKMSFRELREFHSAELKDGWEFTTSHFQVQAAGDLPDVLRACVDLELLYHAYYQRFQETVGFWEIQQPVKVRIYSSQGEMPPLTGNADAYFEPISRIVYCAYRDGIAQHLVHWSTYAILRQSIREFARDDPDVPGWFGMGLGSYLEKAFTGTPGDRSYDPTTVHEKSFEVHDQSDNTDSIQRVLNYELSDFYASTDQSLKYAQAYTLVHFLLHSGDDEIFDGSSRFLASIYQRKGSPSHFKDAMRLSGWDEFEQDWTDYVSATLARAQARAGGE